MLCICNIIKLKIQHIICAGSVLRVPAYSMADAMLTPKWKRLPRDVRLYIHSYIDPVSRMMLYMAHLRDNHASHFGCTGSDCEDQHVNSPNDWRDIVNTPTCNWYFFRNECASRGYINLLRHFVIQYSGVNSTHLSWKGFWYAAARANQVSTMIMCQDIAADCGVKISAGGNIPTRKFKWDDCILLDDIAGMGVFDAYVWLRKKWCILERTGCY